MSFEQPPTIKELDMCLDMLINWERFALHLPGMEIEDIEEIKKINTHGDVNNNQKMALYKRWMNRHPNPSWNDITKALTTAKENSIASQIQKYVSQCSLLPMSPKKQQPPSSPNTATPTQSDEYQVPESIVEELEELHEAFVPIATEVKSELVEAVDNGKVSVRKLAIYVHEQSVPSHRTNGPPINSSTSAEQILQSVQHQYTFLSPNLILNLAIYFLVYCPLMVKKAEDYRGNITSFKRRVEVRLLKKELGRFNEQFRRSPTLSILKIIVKNAWGEQSIRLVETLLLTLFPIVHPDDLPWYSVCAGSLLLSFIAANRLMLPIIVCCARKMELMRHLGIMSVTIGRVLIRVNTNKWVAHNNDSVSFKGSLIQATAGNNIEAADFLLNKAQVYVDAIDETNSIIIRFYYEHMQPVAEDKAVDTLKYCSEQLKAISNAIELQLLIMSGYDDHPNISHDFLRKIEYHIFNSEYLRSRLGHLPNPIKQKLEDLYQLVEENLKITKIGYLQKLLESFPSLNYTTKITINLHSKWSACSVTNVDQAIKLLFPETPVEEFYWFRVKESNRALKISLQLITQGHQSVYLDRYSANVLGVIKVQVNNATIFESRENNGYTFEKGMQAAKLDKEKVLLMSIIQRPCPGIYKSSIEPDDNNNYQSCPDSDSTPLLIACCNNNLQLVKLLLEHGADPNFKTQVSNSAIFYCASSSRVFQLLIDYGAEIHDESLLEHACIINSVKVVDILLKNKYPHINKQGANGYTALWRACARGHIDVVNLLLEAKADPTIADDTDSTPLYGASCNGRLSVVERLLKAKMNPDHRNVEGKTPLWIACAFGRTTVVECLLQAQADPHTPDIDDVTPLQIALRRNHVRTANVLFNHVLASYEKNEDKVAWIANATGQLTKDVVKLFLQARTDPSIIDRMEAMIDSQ